MPSCRVGPHQRLLDTKPRPLLFFRCLILAYQTHRTQTTRVVVATVLRGSVTLSPPWDDEAALTGFVQVVKLLLPKSVPVLLMVGLGSTYCAPCCVFPARKTRL